MPAPSPYRSRLFQSVHHHSVKTARRAQRAWREIKTIASLGVQAVAYSFQHLWQIVQASHLQMSAASQQVRLGSASESGDYAPSSTQAASKAVARVLSLARSLPLLGAPEASKPLQAPTLLSAPQPQQLGDRSAIQQVAQTSPITSSRKTSVAPTLVGIRAIASQLDERHVVLVTRHNELLDCLTADQQTVLLQRIDTELALLAAAPQPVQIVHQPSTWQESISRLVLPAQRLRQLPAATERLLQSPIEHWQRLSQSTSLRAASTHRLVEPLQELVTRIPPKQTSQIASQLALPPARQLVHMTAQLTELIPKRFQPSQSLQPPKQFQLPKQLQLPKSLLPSQLRRAELLPPPATPLRSAAAPATVLAWKQHLQQQFQSLWHRAIQSNVRTIPIHSAKADTFLESLPIARSAWATRQLKPFRRSAGQWPDLNALKSVEAPLLPPSPPQPLLTPATIGFLRPEARGYVVLSRTPHNSLVKSPSLENASEADCSETAGLNAISSSAKSVAASRSRSTATQARSPKQRQKQSSLKTRSNQPQAVSNTYIDVEATDLGYDTSVMSRSVHWLDRGVYAIEESALKAWQWWCELVEPEGAPKPINTLGASQEGRELLVAGTRRSQDIVIASAELGVALFQELWPLMWHLLSVLGRRAGQATFRIVEWMISVVLPVVGRLTMSLLKMGANWAQNQAGPRNSRK
ncbi:MAG: hypothetical protein AB4050_20375 [Synechococcus sp.]